VARPFDGFRSNSGKPPPPRCCFCFQPVRTYNLVHFFLHCTIGSSRPISLSPQPPLWLFLFWGARRPRRIYLRDHPSRPHHPPCPFVQAPVIGEVVGVSSSFHLFPSPWRFLSARVVLIHRTRLQVPPLPRPLVHASSRPLKFFFSSKPT